MEGETHSTRDAYSLEELKKLMQRLDQQRPPDFMVQLGDDFYLVRLPAELRHRGWGYPLYSVLCDQGVHDRTRARFAAGATEAGMERMNRIVSLKEGGIVDGGSEIMSTAIFVTTAPERAEFLNRIGKAFREHVLKATPQEGG